MVILNNMRDVVLLSRREFPNVNNLNPNHRNVFPYCMEHPKLLSYVFKFTEILIWETRKISILQLVSAITRSCSLILVGIPPSDYIKR